MTRELRITLTKSLIGVPEKHRRIVAGLGFRKRLQTVVHQDSPEVRGMIRKIPHMLKVEG